MRAAEVLTLRSPTPTLSPMKQVLNAGILVLLLVLAIEAAGINRSLRRIAHETRRPVTPAWYFIRPPLVHNTWDFTAPLSQWERVGTYTTEKDCRHYLTGPAMPSVGMSRMYILPEAQSRRCVASDDPRLK